MQVNDHLRFFVAKEIDDAVVKAAITSPRVQANVRDIKLANRGGN